MTTDVATLRLVPHPISGALYRELGDGTVRIDDEARGVWGLFTIDGRHLDGPVTHADLALLQFVGGATMPADKDVYWGMAPVYDDHQAVGLEGGSPVPPGRQASGPPVIARYTGDQGVDTAEGRRSSSYLDQDFFLDNDRKPNLVPAVYRLRSPMPGGPDRVGTERFYGQAFHDREVEHIWQRTWQMACREDDIPNVGDYLKYDIAHLSFLIVRTGERAFKAHLNACPHRGRILREHDGTAAREFRCPYHGWSWSLDGAVKEITCEWDLPGVRDDVAQLPGASVGLWGGFVFINPDPAPEPLQDFLGPVMLAHYAKLKLENRYKQAHVARPINANWKVVMEAFMESYHVISTHPQMLLSGGDVSDVRYDVFGNFSRAGHVGTSVNSPQRSLLKSPEVALAAYRAAADANKAFLQGIIGEEVEDFSDAELNDVTFNDVFPNLHPWGAWGRMVFRFRPRGSNPEASWMDIMMLAPWPTGKPKPPAAKLQVLREDESWTAATALGAFARILDQDVFNLPKVQAGLRMKQPPTVWYSAYQEGKIRNFHRNYDRRMGIDDQRSHDG